MADRLFGPPGFVWERDVLLRGAAVVKRAVEHGAVFTPQGLAHGQNQRNLAVLRTVDKIRRIVYGDEAAEG